MFNYRGMSNQDYRNHCEWFREEVLDCRTQVEMCDLLSTDGLTVFPAEASIGEVRGRFARKVSDRILEMFSDEKNAPATKLPFRLWMLFREPTARELKALRAERAGRVDA